MSLTNLLVPTFTQMLKALSGWLDKAEKHLGETEAAALLTERLAPDMFPLSTQIRFVCLQAQEPAYRLRGAPLPEALDALAREGRKAGELPPGSLAAAQGRIAEALSVLGDLEPQALDAGADRSVTLELPSGLVFDMTGDEYVRDWALPQFYFHLNMAYAILRSRKIEFGKADYVPHMFAYLRPGTMSRG